MKIHKISKFSQVPLDRKVFILNKDNNWGFGTFFKWTQDSCGCKADGKIYCDFYSPEQSWLGEEKTSFIGWMEIPKR